MPSRGPSDTSLDRGSDASYEASFDRARLAAADQACAAARAERRGRIVVGMDLLALVALAIACPDKARAEANSRSIPAATPPLAQSGPPQSVDFHRETASRDARDVANWVLISRDNHALPFAIVDKINAKVFVFDGDGTMKGAAAALLGMARGDDSVPGIGQRKLATISPRERNTPAGRFEAALGRDFEQDILWIDYAAALSLHRVIVGNPTDRRAARLASPSVLDNRISFGCINVPAAFYDDVVKPAFTATVGIVYILPETRPLRAVFAIPEQPLLAKPTAR